MNKEQFIIILKNYQELLNKIRNLEDVGVNLYDSKYEIMSNIDIIFDFLLDLHYSEFGINWIFWFMYENDFGKNGYEATDNGILICQTVEGLYDYIEQYKL